MNNKLSQLFYLLLGIIFLSCSSNENNKQHHNPTPIKSDFKTNEKDIYNKQECKSKLSFKQFQDSLRIVVYNSKPDTNIKSSILQELYLRGLVSRENDMIRFILPFDLHGLDCGAPDCYSTDFEFEIPYKNPIEFPKTIEFSMREWGCYIEEEIRIKGKLKLMEISSNFVNYYSNDTKGNLIIMKGEKCKLYYFPNTKPNSIKVNLIENMLEKFNDENPKFEFPYQSTIMNAYEYDRFINKK